MANERVNRREFGGFAAMLMGAMAGLAGEPAAIGQSGCRCNISRGPRPRPMKELTSGVFKPQPGRGMVDGHESHQFLAGC